MPDKHAVIDIHTIDTDDDRYKISLSDDDITHLCRSIQSTGLICPVLLRPVTAKGKSYIVISGFNRLRALTTNKISQVSAMVADDQLTEPQYLIKAIASKSFKKNLSHAEMVICLKRLNWYYSSQEIADHSIDIFNTVLNTGFIDNLLTIAPLAEPGIDLIHQGLLSIKSARRLIGLPEPSIHIFLTLFSQIKASSSKQLEMITFMKEISAREGCSIETIYQKYNIQNIINDDQIPPGVKTNLIRNILFEKRFPALSSSRQTIGKKIAALSLGNGMKLTPPENLEGLNYSISFTAKTADEFKKKVTKLSAASQTQEFIEIFKP